MLNYNEIRERKFIVLDGDPYEVVDAHIFRKQQRKPVNNTKLRNLINGSVKQQTFHSYETVEEADISKNKIKYIFKKDNRQTGNTEYWFCEVNDKSKRFMIDGSIIDAQTKKFMKENSDVDAMFFEGNVIGIELPLKMSLKVIEAAPAVKGNTATGATKTVKLETGAEVNVPLFIKEGDIVSIKVETGEYTERVS